MGLEVGYFIKIFNNKLRDIDENIKKYTVRIKVLDETDVFDGDSINIDKLLNNSNETLYFFISDSLPGLNARVVVKDLELYTKFLKSSMGIVRGTEQFKNLRDKVKVYIAAILSNYKSYKEEIDELNAQKNIINEIKDLLENGFDLSNGIDTENLSTKIKKLQISDVDKTNLSMILLRTITDQLAIEKEKREKKRLEELEKRKNEALLKRMNAKPRETKENNIRKLIDEIINNDEELKEKIENYGIIIDDLKNNIYNQISLRKDLDIKSPEFKEALKVLIKEYVERIELEKKKGRYKDIILNNTALYSYIKNQLGREYNNNSNSESIVIDLVVNSCISNNTAFDVNAIYEVAKKINLSYFNRIVNEISTSINITKGLYTEGSGFIRNYGRTDFTEEEVLETVDRIKDKNISVEILEKNLAIITAMHGFLKEKIDLLYKYGNVEMSEQDILAYTRLNMIIDALIDLNKTISFNKDDSLSDILLVLDDVMDAILNSSPLKVYKEFLISLHEAGTYEELPNPFEKVLFLDGVDILIENPSLVELKAQMLNILNQMESTNVYEEMSIKAHNFKGQKNKAVVYLHKNKIFCLTPDDARVFMRRVGCRKDGERFDRYVIVFAEQKDAQGTNELINAGHCYSFMTTGGAEAEFKKYILLAQYGYVYINSDGEVLDPKDVSERDIPTLTKYTYEEEQERQRKTANKIASYLGFSRGGMPND